MNRKQRINDLLTDIFNDFSIKVIDNSHLHVGHNNFDGTDETHIKILLTNKYSKKINRLEIHKKINEILKEEFSSGLHSIEININ
tara:strand:- start:574 stop:828 length:255 start_codon:yes stop_codon:yes gene_type:complete